MKNIEEGDVEDRALKAVLETEIDCSFTTFLRCATSLCMYIARRA